MKAGTHLDPGSRVYLGSSLRGFLPAFWIGLGLIICWELVAILDATMSGRDATLYLYGHRTRIPIPHLLAIDFASSFPGLAQQALITFKSTLAGFAAGVLIGVASAIAMWRSRTIEATFYPYAVASQMLPTLAIAPIISYIIPNASLARVLIASYLTFFPVMVNVVRGLKSTSGHAVDLFETYGASRWQKFIKLHFPSSLPYLFTGMRVGTTQSVIAAIVVEFMGARDGIGVVIVRAGYYGGTNIYRLWSAVIFAGMLAAIMYLAVNISERYLTPWQPDIRKTGE